MDIKKWFSRKFSLALVGIFIYSNLPILFRKVEVSDSVTLASLAGISLIIAHYFKVNVKEKVEEKVQDVLEIK